jgi:hypothetical protein
MGKKKTKNNPPKNDQQFLGDLFLFGTATVIATYYIKGNFYCR